MINKKVDTTKKKFTGSFLTKLLETIGFFGIKDV